MDGLDAHWRRLIGVVAFLMAAAFILPVLVRAPNLQENRELSPPPPWPRHLSEAPAFRDGVEAAVADRFPARRFLIPFLNAARLPLGVSGSGRVIVGRDGWLFYDNGSHLGAARGSEALSPAQTRAWLQGLAGRTEALGAVPYLVLTPPVKETVFPRFAPGWMGPPAPDRPAPRLARLAQETVAGTVLYPLDAVAAQGPRAYSRHDTHWTGYGAYGGYETLMRALQARGVGQGPRPRSAFVEAPIAYGAQQADLANMEGVKGFVRLDNPQLIDPRVQGRVAITYLGADHSWMGPRVIETGEVGKPTLMLTVDSFSNALLPLLYGDFSRLIVAHNQDGPWRPDLIAAYHPDAVVLEVLETGLASSLVPGPPASPQARDRIDQVLGPAPALRPVGAEAAALDPAPPASCGLDVAELTPTSVGGPGWRLRAAGWISDLGPGPGLVAGRIRLTGPGGDWVGDLAVTQDRPDVAAFFHKPQVAVSGYEQTVSTGPLAAGAYAVRLYRRTPGGWVSCKGRDLTLGGRAP